MGQHHSATTYRTDYCFGGFVRAVTIAGHMTVGLCEESAGRIGTKEVGTIGVG